LEEIQQTQARRVSNINQLRQALGWSISFSRCTSSSHIFDQDCCT
jgi:hypothetical protein